MSNFIVQTTVILGKEIRICLRPTQNINQPPKGLTLPCDILGLQGKNYLTPKKDSFWSGLNNISLEAITICSYLSIDLSSIEKINDAIANNKNIIEKWEEIRKLCNSDWNKMCDYMAGKDVEMQLTSNQPNNDIENPIITDSFSQINFENAKNGDILLEGLTRFIVYNEDSISLEATVRTGGLGGMLDDAIRIQNENIFFEDIRGITVYEGKGVSNVVMTSIFGGNTDKAVFDSISYIRFELKGVNDIRTYSPNQHPYTVTISSTQIKDAQRLKNFLDVKIREYRNSIKIPVQTHQSNADELLKYSSLLEKGLISNDEFETLKKKILGF